MTPPTFYLTTAIFYPNDKPHIGHAYELLATDALARFKRLDGYDVFFLTGTDEYGQKIQQTAERKNKTPLELINEMAPYFQEMASILGGAHNDFIRTSEARHHTCVQKMWQRMEESGDIYLGTYSGFYSVRDEAFWAEKELTEKDGKKYAPTGTPVEWVEEESYFFRLSAYQDRLLELYQKNPTFIAPLEKRNEMLSFVEGGLQDLSISRTTFDWGVKVPNNPRHIVYVWVDALTNYLSATGLLENGERSHFWPPDLHIIGKDVLRFHAVYWPAFLMSAGLPLPKRIFAHGFLLNRGEKMSKSLGNVIDPLELVNQYGVDQVRYFFLREVPFGQDGHYSHEAITQRVNADLANDLGNLAQRSLSMIAKNCEGKIPTPQTLEEADHVILKAVAGLLAEVRLHHEEQALHRALEAIWQKIAETNRYFAAQEPWAHRKTNPERMQTILYVTAEILRNLGILCQPYLPQGAGHLLDLLAVSEDQRTFAYLNTENRLSPGKELPLPAPIFPRILEKLQV